MATVIRSPRLSKKPRKLGSETSETMEIRPEAAAAQVQDASAHYAVPEKNPVADTVPEPAVHAVSEEEYVELERRLVRAESRAEVAEQELAAMRSEIQALRAEAREEGYAAGCEEANSRLDTEYRLKLDSVQRVLQALSTQLEQLVAQAEDAIVETVYAAVVKIIGERMADPDSILAMVKQVSSQFVRPDNFIVRLMPADYELVAAAQQLTSAGGNESTAIKIVPDPRVEAGGCILESAAGSLDARLEVQLQRLKDVLLDSRLRRQSELQGKK